MTSMLMQGKNNEMPKYAFIKCLQIREKCVKIGTYLNNKLTSF